MKINKVKMKKYIMYLLLIFILFSCKYPPKEVLTVLDAARENRGELEKVIDH